MQFRVWHWTEHHNKGSGEVLNNPFHYLLLLVHCQIGMFLVVHTHFYCREDAEKKMRVGVSVSYISTVGFLVEMERGRYVVLFGGLVSHHCFFADSGRCSRKK